MPPARVFNSFSYSAFAAACLSCCVLAATTTSRERESDCLAGEPVSFPSRDGDPVFLGGDRSKERGPEGPEASTSILPLVEASRGMHSFA